MYMYIIMYYPGIYIFISFQKLYSVREAHNIFVTGLDFLPSSKAKEEVTGDKDFTLLSISADNTIRVHQVAKRSKIYYKHS